MPDLFLHTGFQIESHKNVGQVSRGVWIAWLMAGLAVFRHACSGPMLWGWGPVLFGLLGSVFVLLLPLAGIEEQCCATLKGLALLRCQLWGGVQRPVVHTTSLTVPFTALDLLPQKVKPSKGTVEAAADFVLLSGFNQNWLTFSSEFLDACYSKLLDFIILILSSWDPDIDFCHL